MSPTLATVLVVTGQVLVVLGAVVFLTAALGVIRFPDAYSRISAVGTAGGTGIAVILTGALLQDPSTLAAVKVAIAIVLQLTTSALGSIAIARSAYLTRTPLAPGTLNELDLAEGEPLTGHESHPIARQ